LVALEEGDPERARAHLADALDRATRVSDSYQWVHAHVLDSCAVLAVQTDAPDAAALVDRLADLAERCGLREMVVRAHAHRGHLGVAGCAQTAALLAAEIDNPALERLLGPPVMA
jgi:hypothetical protein